MFDSRRARRALDRHLGDGDAVQVAATDDVTGSVWCLTTREIVVVKKTTVVGRLPLDRLHGEVRATGGGTEVRLTDARGGPVLIASFRRRNTLTARLAALLHADPPA